MSGRSDPVSHRIFLTGATGSMGLAATRDLISRGDQVVGVARSAEGAQVLLELGATPIEVDLFDVEAVQRAVDGCDVVAHFATKIPVGNDATKADAWQLNDRLRIEGTANLIAAAEAIGIRRFIFESISLAYPDGGQEWIDESVDLDPIAPMMDSAVEAEAMLAAFAERGGESVTLRFGRVYGPGRASDGFVEAVCARQMPIIGNGKNFVSSVHVGDAGGAIADAVEVVPGTYNIVDDEPMTQRELMATAAEALAAPPPRRIPYAIARVAAGKAARVMDVSQRVSNRRFREATDWAPRYRSATDGWAATVAATEVESVLV